MPRILRSILACVLIFTAIAAPALAAQKQPEPDETLSVCTTQPWITSIARFLAGTTLKVIPLSSWTENGGLRRTRAKADAPVIVLDPKDARAFGIDTSAQNVYTLYESFPVRDIARGTITFDPSVLPFMSQRLLIAISEIDMENYPFHQRRLAEFQSRLESTLEIGRSLIGGLKILDLTGSIGPWIGAAADTVRPPDDLREAWIGSTRTNELRLALTEAHARSWWIVTDPWTPPVVRKIVANEPRLIHISAPTDAEYDFFDYLHDIYLKIWSSVTQNGEYKKLPSR